MKFKVPGKALLFGEYGVLKGFPAIAMSVPSYMMEIEILKGSKQRWWATIESQLLSDSLVIDGHSSDSESDHAQFFYSILVQYQTFFETHSLEIKVTKSFSPGLGLGSSSSFMASLHKFFQLELNFSDAKLWENIFESIKLFQGKGSGYDVSVQLASMGHTEPEYFSYTLEKPIPKLVEVKPFVAGVFVETGVISKTREVILLQQNDYSNAHGELASEYLNIKSKNELGNLMNRSKAVSLKQGILFSETELVRTLDRHSIPFKTMGAGGGDCLWILATRGEILEKIPESNVVFAFEDHQ